MSQHKNIGRPWPGPFFLGPSPKPGRWRIGAVAESGPPGPLRPPRDTLVTKGSGRKTTPRPYGYGLRGRVRRGVSPRRDPFLMGGAAAIPGSEPVETGEMIR